MTKRKPIAAQHMELHDHSVGLPSNLSREQLPGEVYLPVLSALTWVAFGRIIDFGEMPRSDPKRFDLVRGAFHETYPDHSESHSTQGADMREHSLPPATSDIIDAAERLLLDRARAGTLAVWGKTRPDSAHFQRIDPSFFFNPIAIDLLDGSLDLAHDAQAETWFRHRNAPMQEKLKRYQVLVSNEDLEKLFGSGTPGAKPARARKPGRPHRERERARMALEVPLP